MANLKDTRKKCQKQPLLRQTLTGVSKKKKKKKFSHKIRLC